MKIINLQAENIKKLIAIEIRPDGNLVQITGKNGQGKTSVLDSIWWALCGAANIQGTPIRNGQNQAKIRLDLGEIVVTRIFKKADDGHTISSLTIENAEGTVIRTPQTLLDKMLGELSFDPLAFARMTKKEQFNELKRFVPDIDFDAIQKAHQADYDKRTNINREAKESRTLADAIFISPDLNPELIDENALIDKLEAAGKHNADIETRRGNRAKLAQDIEMKSVESNNALKRIEELKVEIAKQTAISEAALTQILEWNTKLQNAPKLPEPKDLALIKAEISDAKIHNGKIIEFTKRKEYIKKAEVLEVEAEKITTVMNAREKDKMAKIAAAKLPIKGLGFGQDEIILNGVAFNQASDAEQLQVSIAMAMALNPKLRIIRVRDGSLLDEDSLKLLGEMAKENDYQVWIERVDSSGKVGIVLEDGHIKGVEVEKEPDF